VHPWGSALPTATAGASTTLSEGGTHLGGMGAPGENRGMTGLLGSHVRGRVGSAAGASG
jgi:hypothetical protein